MKHPIWLFFIPLLAGCAAAPQLSAPPAAVPSGAAQSFVWVQLGDGDNAELRAVVETPTSRCPQFDAPSGPIILAPRAKADDKFALICSAALSKGISVAGIAPLKDRPERILVLGDTGCRLEGAAIQNCNDPRAWPFPALALAASKLKPDLVIHLGDYQYRQTPCPPGNTGCAGTPYGDNWPAWKADFFAPAAPLLAAAPFVFVRGNHEECAREGGGFLRLLGPLAWRGSCIPHLAPYRISLGDFDLLVMDNADASDTEVDPAKLPVYQAELAEAVKPSPVPVWLAQHRPIWAAIAGPLGIPVGGNAQIIAAAEKIMPTKPVSLMLSGHIHTFQAINYARQGGPAPPPQLVAGNGGDSLHVTPANLKGALFQGRSGVSVKDGLSVGGFGFLLMTRGTSGWTIDLYDSAGTPEGQCLFTFASGRLDCPKLPG